jgi:hypothetical protein
MYENAAPVCQRVKRAYQEVISQVDLLGTVFRLTPGMRILLGGVSIFTSAFVGNRSFLQIVFAEFADETGQNIGMNLGILEIFLDFFLGVDFAANVRLVHLSAQRGNISTNTPESWKRLCRILANLIYMLNIH